MTNMQLLLIATIVQYFIIYVLIMEHEICHGMPRWIRLLVFPFHLVFALVVVGASCWDWLTEDSK